MNKEEMKTRDLYMLEALRLFSEKGYDSTGVAEIAKAVGCTTSALYKHFPNKKALFDAIIEKGKTDFEKQMTLIHGSIALSDDEVPKPSVELQTKMLLNMFRILTEDNAPKYFRRLVNLEQNKLPELSDVYSRYLVSAQMRSYRKLFELWIEKGYMRPANPGILSIQFVSPMMILVDLCDMNPELAAQTPEILKLHVEQFNEANVLLK